MPYPYDIGDDPRNQFGNDRLTYPSYFSNPIGPYVWEGKRFLFMANHAYASGSGATQSYLRALASSDQGETWLEVDQVAHKQVPAPGGEGAGNFTTYYSGSGSVVTVAYLDGSGTNKNSATPPNGWVASWGYSIRITSFDLSTETWGVSSSAGPQVFDRTTNSGSWGPEYGLHIVHRPDGQVIVLYQGRGAAPDYGNRACMVRYYALPDPPVEWSEPVAIDIVTGGADGLDYPVGIVYNPANGITHLFVVNAGSDANDAILTHTSLSALDSLSAPQTIYHGMFERVRKRTGNPILFSGELVFPFMFRTSAESVPPEYATYGFALARANSVLNPVWSIDTVTSDPLKVGYVQYYSTLVGSYVHGEGTWASVSVIRSFDGTRLLAYTVTQDTDVREWEYDEDTGEWVDTVIVSDPGWYMVVNGLPFQDGDSYKIGFVVGYWVDATQYFEFTTGSVSSWMLARYYAV